MSQRNPMNERYQEEHKGQTKKSAASAKPKTKAASSVYVKPAGKTPQEKKAAQKANRQKQRELDTLYYNPPTDEYKKLKRLWWVLLFGAVILTVLAMVLGYIMPDNTQVTWACLIPAYACIIAALWLDFTKIRKVRRAYQLEMMKKHPKETKKHQVTHATNLKAEGKEKEREEKKKVKRFGHVFGGKKEEVAAKEDAAQKKAEEEAAAKAAQEAADAKKPIAQLKAEHEAAKKAKEAEAK